MNGTLDKLRGIARAYPVPSVLFGAAIGLTSSMVILSLIKLSPLTELYAEAGAMVAGAALAVWLVRGNKRSWGLKRLDKRGVVPPALAELDHEFECFMRPRNRALRILGRVWAAIWKDLGQQFESYGEQYYSAPRPPDGECPPSSHQNPS